MRTLFNKNGLAGRIGRFLFAFVFIVSLLTPPSVNANTPTDAFTTGTIQIDDLEFELSDEGKRDLGISKNPKLDSVLAQVAETAKSANAKALEEANAHLLNISGNRVQVQVTTSDKLVQAAVKSIEESGGEVSSITQDKRYLQAWLPFDSLITLAENDAIFYIRQAAELVLFDDVKAGSSTTEGLAAMNAAAWHSAGYTGSGVKVAVIDGGFTGYTSLLGTDLPASVTAKNFVDGENDSEVDGSSAHGTACAEIVHDLAPDASLYLVKISTNLDLEEAVTWLISQNVDVISTSLGWYNLSPGDGTGFFEDIVAQAKAAGIFWTTAASNDREAHWGGLFNDPESDSVHNFNGTQNVNYFGPGDGNAWLIPSGYTIRAFLRWNDWTDIDQDFDLRIVRDNGTTWDTVAVSGNTQNGLDGQTPTEYVSYTTSGDTTVYGLVIISEGATDIVNFELFVPKFVRMDENVYERSLSNLADAPSAMTVAALDSSSPYPQESYSSEGPTNGPGGALTGGVTKPDISAYANVATESYTGSTFNGTSSATPHVAGAAAITLSAYPGYSPDQIAAFLEGRAEDMGDAGKDTVFGSGRLTLGDTPATGSDFSVTNISPANAAFNIADDANITVQFEETINMATVDGQSFVVRGSQTGLVEGVYSSGSVIFNPNQDFRAGEEVFVNLTDAIRSDGNNSLSPYAWNFTVGAAAGTGEFSNTNHSLGTGTPEHSLLGDFDGDGDLDIFVGNGGTTADEIWFNDGSGRFTDSGQSLGNSYSRSAVAGDIDNDGDLDIVVGSSNTNITIWLNNGSGVFNQMSGTLSDTSTMGLDLADLDNDGDLDIWVSRPAGQANRVLFNGGSGNFTDSGQMLGNENDEAVTLGDVDNDGDLDAFISIYGPNEIWLNDGEGTFTDSGQNLGNFHSRAASLGDLDGDGDLDVFVANEDAANKVWINDGAGNYSDSGQSFGSDHSWGVALGDVDADGDLDAVVSNGFGEYDEILLNNGSGVFTDSGQDLFYGESLSVVLGDIDNDKDLDAVFSTTVWENLNPAFSVTDVTPDNAVVNVAVDSSISATTDETVDYSTLSAQTFTVRGDQSGLYSGTYSGSSLMFDPSQNFKPGEKITVNLTEGIQSDSSSSLNPYSWSFVAAAGVASGEFRYTNHSITPGGDDSALGDLDGDGDLDFVYASDGGTSNRVWMNNGAGTFTDSSQALAAYSTREVELGDLDNDGDLDLVTGGDNSSVDIWLNDASGQFSKSSSVLNKQNLHGLEIADLDSDGDLDIFTSHPGTGSYVWLNDGFGNFADSGQSLADSGGVSLDIGDLDGDGDLDVFIARNGPNYVWLNDGNGNFSDSGQTLGNEDSRAGILGDVDGDGDLDAFTGDYDQPNRVWLNDGSGIFSDSGQRLGNEQTRGVTFADIDGDGDLDVVTATEVGDYDKVWLNNGSGVFSDSGQNLADHNNCTVSLGDIDGDGDMDAVYAGWIWENMNPAFYVTSVTPDNATVDVAMNSNVYATTGETVNYSTVTAQTFTVRGEQSGLYSGTYSGSSLMFDPNQNFKPGEEIIVNLTNEILSGGGDALDPYAWSFTAAVGSGSGEFSNTNQTLSTGTPEVSLLGDLDGDGDLDIFVGNGEMHADKIWFNDGEGSFSKSDQSLGNNFTRTAALGDIDNDGDLDIVVGADDINITIWLNNDSGIFSQMAGTLNNTTTHGLDLADLDSDGDLDLWISRPGSADQVWLNDGSGNFTDSGQTLGNDNDEAVTLGDLDNDGDLDAFTAANGANKVWLNNGHAVFSDSGQSLGNLHSWHTVLGDVDADGDLDAFVGNEIAPNKVWLNNGSGVFTDSGQSLGNEYTRGVALGDVDADGDLDAVFANGHAEYDEVWLNDGVGNFTDSGQNLLYIESLWVVLGDIDSDGDLDAVFSNSVWENVVQYSLYLPLALNNYANVIPVDPPAAPTLNDIDNADGNGSFEVSWNDVDEADSYVLEEADNSAFTGATEIYSGDNNVYSVSGKSEGTYYYRVRAVNIVGSSGWSNTKSAVVSPSSGDCQTYTFGTSFGQYVYSDGRTWNFTAESDLQVSSMEVRSILGSTGGVFHIQVKINGSIIEEWDQTVTSTTYQAYDHLSSESFNLNAGDTITYFIYGGTMSTPVGGIRGESYVKLCGNP